MTSELIYLSCINGCELFADKDEYYLDRMQGPVFCHTYGEPFLPKEKIEED